MNIVNAVITFSSPCSAQVRGFAEDAAKLYYTDDYATVNLLPGLLALGALGLALPAIASFFSLPFSTMYKVIIFLLLQVFLAQIFLAIKHFGQGNYFSVATNIFSPSTPCTI